VVLRVEAEECPIPYGHRHSRSDRRANQQVRPDTTADSDRPCPTVFFSNCAADIVGQSTTDCFTNEVTNIHGSVLKLSALVAPARGCGQGRAMKFSIPILEKRFPNVSPTIVAYPS
jgi:hypothetical protein